MRGLGSVDLAAQDFGPIAWVLTEVLGFRRSSEHAENGKRVVFFELGSGDPGTGGRLIEELDAPRARLGRGRVHHVAFRTPDDEEHAAWRERIAQTRPGVTPQIGRYILSFNLL
jgi:glyoxalase family protein